MEIPKRVYLMMEWEIHYRRYLTQELKEISEYCLQMQKTPLEQLREIKAAIHRFDIRMFDTFRKATDEQIEKELKQNEV